MIILSLEKEVIVLEDVLGERKGKKTFTGHFLRKHRSPLFASVIYNVVAYLLL